MIILCILIPIGIAALVFWGVIKLWKDEPGGLEEQIEEARQWNEERLKAVDANESDKMPDPSRYVGNYKSGYDDPRRYWEVAKIGSVPADKNKTN